MHWTAKAPLFAGVSALAVLLGNPPAINLDNSRSAIVGVPLQIGTPAMAQSSVSVSVFFDRLSSHGRWVSNPRHGYVFVPTGVGRDWRPYTEGRWVYTDDYGWYWDSSEPFGWATYHYGRWGYSRAYGWYWVPGNVWAPAWVTWRTGGDHIGWAPLAPEGSGYAWGASASGHPPVAESWIFVETRHLTAPTIVEYVAPVREIPIILTQATTRVDMRVEQNVVINQPIEITQIQNVFVEPVQTVNVTFGDDPDEATSADGDIVAFQADIGEEEPAEAPADVVESADQIEEPAVLEETLDEVPADADAPSAAEVDDNGDATSSPVAGDDEQPVDATAPAEGETAAPSGEDATEGDTELTPETEEQLQGNEATIEEPAEGEAAPEQATPPAEGASEQPVEGTDVLPSEPSEQAPAQPAAESEQVVPPAADEAMPQENEQAPGSMEPNQEAPAAEDAQDDANDQPTEDGQVCPEGQATC